MSSDGGKSKRQDDYAGADISDEGTSQNKIAEMKKRREAQNKMRCKRYRDKKKKETIKTVRSIYKEPTSIVEKEEVIKCRKEYDKQRSQRYRDKKRASNLIKLQTDINFIEISVNTNTRSCAEMDSSRNEFSRIDNLDKRNVVKNDCGGLTALESRIIKQKPENTTTDDSEDKLGVMIEVKLEPIETEPPDFNDDVATFKFDIVKREPDDITTDDPLDTAGTAEEGPAAVKHVISAAAIKQEMDIEPTVLQQPDIYFMPLPCKSEPVEGHSRKLEKAGFELNKKNLTQNSSLFNDKEEKLTSNLKKKTKYRQKIDGKKKTLAQTKSLNEQKKRKAANSKAYRERKKRLKKEWVLAPKYSTQESSVLGSQRLDHRDDPQYKSQAQSLINVKNSLPGEKPKLYKIFFLRKYPRTITHSGLKPNCCDTSNVLKGCSINEPSGINNLDRKNAVRNDLEEIITQEPDYVTDGSLNTLGVMTEVKLMAIKCEVPVTSSDSTTFECGIVKREPDGIATDDPLLATNTAEGGPAAGQHDVFSAAATKQEMDIEPTVLQRPDVYFMTLPCKAEPIEGHSRFEQHDDPDRRTQAQYPVDVKLVGSRTCMLSHSWQKPHCCEICKKCFSRKSDLRIHSHVHSEVAPFSCVICKRSFSYKSFLKRHMLSHSKKITYCCEICKKCFSRQYYFKTHTCARSSEKSYCCDICKKKFSQKSNLRVHVLRHSGEKRYRCEICERFFYEKSHLHRHMQVHSGEKPYYCKICKKYFSYKYILRDHVKSIHLKEKPYCCEICKKCFCRKNYLKSHMRVVHLGEKPYCCEICNKYFSYKSILRTHMTTHSGEKRH